MNITSDKLTLRAVEERDLPLLKEMMNDGEIERFVGGWSFPISDQQHRKWYESIPMEKNILRLIVETNDHRAIGTIMLTDIDWKNRTAQIHIKLASSQERGKGYGSHAISMLVEYAFRQMGLFCVYALILNYNLASIKAFTKAGFLEEGILRSRIYKDGSMHDLVSLSVVNDAR